MSSPNLNNLIIVGCILTYTSVIFLGLDSYMTSTQAFPYICTARAWILMSGFTLSFGSMFSKTWRVHSIFTNVQLNKKVMKDSQLYLVVGLLMCIDVVTMTAWQLMDPFYRDTKKLEPYVSIHKKVKWRQRKLHRLSVIGLHKSLCSDFSSHLGAGAACNQPIKLGFKAQPLLPYLKTSFLV